VDLSASTQFGTQGQLKAEFIAEITAVLSFSALSNQDKVGLLLFTDMIEKYLPPRKGRKYTLQILRDILFHEPRGKGTDLEAALSFTLRLLKKHTIIFVISDFLAHDYMKPLQLLSNKHDVIALQIVDPAERDLPGGGPIRIYNPETGESDIFDLSDKKLHQQYSKFIQLEQERLTNKMKQAKVDLISLRTDQPYFTELQKFFEIRIKRRKR
jgi:uncharacterized protein (DUF58 family)